VLSPEQAMVSAIISVSNFLTITPSRRLLGGVGRDRSSRELRA
jgi:hypothetical protein